MLIANHFWTACFCAGALALYASAQTPSTLLRVDVENWVAYGYDVTDPSALAKTASIVAPAAPRNFGNFVHFADITGINGNSAKGTLVLRTQVISLTPAPIPGQAIGDVVRTQHAEFSFEFLQPDGKQIGSIYAMGLAGGVPAPGSPADATAGNNTIVGGTGPFVGARGTVNQGQVTSRIASQIEDPSMRRINGGGRGQFLLQIVPMVRPEVLLSEAGLPVVFHADWSAVEATNPVRAGERLIVYATGLGPTAPSIGPGQVFPSDHLAWVTSPVEVIVDGKVLPAINAVGVPETGGTYRVDFRVPDDSANRNLSFKLRVAWIEGTGVMIQVK